MDELPVVLRPFLRRLSRRLTLGLFLEIWPQWAVAALLIAGGAALLGRLFFERAASFLPWLWLAPLAAGIPALAICYRRRYRPTEIVALADSLNGGRGLLLTLFETGSAAWKAPAGFELPHLRPWRRLSMLLPAAAFLAAGLFIPQRTTPGSSTLLANEIAAELETTLAELKQQDLVTPDEEKQLEQEIGRIRKDALERMDASSWEAADALREKMAGNLSEKQDAVQWAQETLARYGAAAAGSSGDSATAGDSDELARAIDKLAASGLLASAPEELQKLLGGKDRLTGGSAQLPSSKEALRKLARDLSSYLARRNFELARLTQRGAESGRLDPSKFPFFNEELGPEGDGEPGEGGVNRGRGDADLTWGQETQSFDRFKTVALPPGSVRSPDDWAPVVELPGAPQVSPEASTLSPARRYADTTGQAAWRRSLSPRHYSAVKKYFDNAEKPH